MLTINKKYANIGHNLYVSHRLLFIGGSAIFRHEKQNHGEEYTFINIIKC